MRVFLLPGPAPKLHREIFALHLNWGRATFAMSARMYAGGYDAAYASNLPNGIWQLVNGDNYYRHPNYHSGRYQTDTTLEPMAYLYKVTEHLARPCLIVPDNPAWVGIRNSVREKAEEFLRAQEYRVTDELLNEIYRVSNWRSTNQEVNQYWYALPTSEEQRWQPENLRAMYFVPGRRGRPEQQVSYSSVKMLEV